VQEKKQSCQGLSASLDTNLLGSIVFAKAVIPYMRKQGGGRVLQISSEQSQMAYPGMSVYAAPSLAACSSGTLVLMNC
jgi:NADP-dependent 3-hydroxy acid dehydrogenase YdfG